MLTVLGIISLFKIPVENLPPVDMGKVFISTIYYGASSKDIEKQVTKKIEDSLKDLENVEFIQSMSMRNHSLVQVKFIDDTDYKKLYDELRFKILNIRNKLPESVDDPKFIYVDTKVWIPVIVVNISSDIPNISLEMIAEDLKHDLENISGVQEVSIAGDFEEEFHITLDPGKLKRYGISYAEVVKTITSYNTKLPAGRFHNDMKNTYLDIGENLENKNQILNIILRKDGDGNFLKVKDVIDDAKLSHRDPDTIVSINGKNSIKLLVKKEDFANSIYIAEKVKEISKEFEKNTQDYNLNIVLTYDSTVEINDSVRILSGNMILGMILVTLILWLTLGFRNAFITAIGIPFSFLVTIIIVKLTGHSINTITLFSFVLVSGIIVDDAIVIIENIYRHIQSGKDKIDAVVDGTSEVFLPVISATLTTVLAFMPMLIMTGAVGEFFSVIPKAVSFALVASLFEALIILPGHVYDWGPIVAKKNNGDNQPNIFTFFWKLYNKILNILLEKKFLAISFTFILFVVALLFIVASVSGIYPFIKIKFFQDSYLRYHIAIKMPPDTSVEGTDKVVRDISNYVSSFGEHEVKSVSGTAGYLEDKDYSIHRAQHYGQIVVEFPNQKEMKLPNGNTNIDEYIDDVRIKIKKYIQKKYKEWGALPEIIVFGENTGPPTGKAVNIRISADTLDNAIKVSRILEDYLKNNKVFDDLTDLDTNIPEYNKILKISVNQKKAAEYGIDVDFATKTIAGALSGTYIGKFLTPSDSVDLLIKISRNKNKGIKKPLDILEIPIFEDSISPLRIGDIADVEIIKEAVVLNRYDTKPTVTITSDIKTGSNLSPSRVKVLLSNKIKDITSKNPGILITFGGEFETTNRAYTSLIIAFLISIMAIYLVLASQFNDYVQPFIILSAVAFAFIGVVFGMFFTRSVFTIGSFMAVVGLAGISVNDSLILIDFMNKNRMKNNDLRESVIMACKVRMRPVLVTTVTTLLGLLPMSIGIPQKSIMWAPMATAFITGLTSATILTLLIIPVEYEVAENLKKLFKRRNKV
jgi:HAE1 family hydrophobic/amphiphilic exporter-1